MNVSNAGLTTFGSAAIASPANDANAVKRDDAQPAPPPQTEAAKEPGTGQLVDKKV